jgi:integrase
MAKRGPRPKPWLRKANQTWYITLDGEQIPLGRTRREADAEYHRLMVAADQKVPGRGRITVRELVDFWLADCRRRLDPETVAGYELHAESFAEKCGGMRAADLKRLHVEGWLDGRTTQGRGREGRPLAKSTRHLAITVVKLAMAWGEDMGYLDRNPIRSMRRPGIDRRAPITVAEAEAVMAAITPAVLPALEVMFATGVRPGELCSMAGERTDLAAGRAIVKGKRTKRNKTGVRVVHLSDVAIRILEPLVAEHPTGPLFWCQGGPLRPVSLRNATDRAREKACRAMGREPGSLDHVKPHCFRGLYATEAMRNRVDSAMVARLIGQADPVVLMEHYASPDDEMLLDAANRASRASRTSPDRP